MSRALRHPSSRRRPVSGAAVALLSVVVLLPLGLGGGVPGAAAAPVGTVSPPAGPTTGGTQVALTVPAATRFTQIATGRQSAFGIDDRGTVSTWDLRPRGTSSIPRVVPMPDGVQVVQIAADDATVMALDADGTVWAWGEGDSGQLGRGDRTSSGAPLQVVLPGDPFVTQISLSRTPLALTDDGRVFAWGASESLGTGAPGGQLSVPVQVPVAGIVSVSSSSTQFALAADGTAQAWGVNEFGELGDGTTTARPLPVPVSLPDGRRFAQISGGQDGHGRNTPFVYEEHTLATATDGTTWTWGEYVTDEPVQYSVYASTTPLQVELPTGVRSTEVTDGGYASFATADDGSAWTWGESAVNTGTTSRPQRPAPLTLPGGRTVEQFTSDGSTSGALATDGAVFWWGSTIDRDDIPQFNSLFQATPDRVPAPGAVTGVSLDGVPVADPVTSAELDADGNRTVTFTAPAHDVGTVPVVVTTDDGRSFPFSYAYGVAPTVTSSALPSGTVGSAYYATLTASGTGPVSFGVVGDSLPAGLVLDGATGLVSGTPTTSGTSLVTISATSPYGTTTQASTVTIAPAAVVAVPAPDASPAPAITSPTAPAAAAPASAVGPSGRSAGLASTGSEPATAVGLGAVLAAAGLALVLATRRRREGTTATSE
jgi:alpha-tubulin suppressor-like RCC1 family protein